MTGRSLFDMHKHKFKISHYECGRPGGMIYNCSCGEERIKVGCYIPPTCPIIDNPRDKRSIKPYEGERDV